MHVEKELHQKIRDMREDRDEKQETLARMLKITNQQYSLYETGKREFKLRHIAALCQHFGVSADYLLGLPDDLRYPKKR